MGESISSFNFLQINRKAKRRRSLQRSGRAVAQFDACLKALRPRHKSSLISTAQKRHFVLGFGRRRRRGGKQQDAAWEPAGGQRGSDYDTQQSNSGHQEKTKRSFISFFILS